MPYTRPTKPANPRRRSTPTLDTAPAEKATTKKVWVDLHASGFNSWVDKMQIRLHTLAQMDVPLFISNKVDLMAVYLRSLPREARRYHTCNTCAAFINRYGRLLCIGADGTLQSAIWHPEDAPAFYHRACANLAIAAKDAGIDAPFISTDETWGTRETGPWTHFGLTPLSTYIAKYDPTATCEQRMAVRREDFRTLTHALSTYRIATLETARDLANSGRLMRAERVRNHLGWLLSLAIDSHRGRNVNMVWDRMSRAPAAYCHVRSTVVGSLLDDIQDGRNLEATIRSFNEKMDPLAYQRPTAAPTEQAIDRAEKLVEQMGIASALMRRIAKPSEIPLHARIWSASNADLRQPSGTFAALRSELRNTDRKSTIDDGSMTWAKFERTVLPQAEAIDVLVPRTGNYTVVCTAVDPQAKPIMKWDGEDDRNPFNWYVWHGGSTASQHGFTAQTWVEVLFITDRPCNWRRAHGYGFPPSRLFFLKGAAETRSAGSALFPECLRSELHEVRKVIEAHRRKHDLPLSNSAAVALPVGDKLSLTVRVTVGKIVRTITIDRME